MAELQSVLRASKTSDGGVTAELIVNAPDGPVRIGATIAPKTADAIRRAVYSWVHAGQPDQAKKAAKAAVMGTDPDELMAPNLKPGWGKSPDMAAPTTFSPNEPPKKARKKKGPISFSAPETETDATLAGDYIAGEFVGIAEDAVMGCALRALRDRTPAKLQGALASAAKGAMKARKSGDSNTVGDTFKFYEDDELANPMDQLSQWVPPPLGVPQASEQAAIISGEHEESIAKCGYGVDLVGCGRIKKIARVAAMHGESIDDTKLAKYAVIDLYNKKQPGQLQAIKYEGMTPEGRFSIRAKTKDGKESLYDVKKGGDLGYIVLKKVEASVQGDGAAPVMPSSVDIGDAKNVLVKWYGAKKPGTLQAITYQGVSPVSNKLKFFAKTTEGLRGFEMERSDVGWRATAMSGDEVGLFGFIKKAAGAVANVAKKGASAAYKYSGTKASLSLARKGVSAVSKVPGLVAKYGAKVAAIIALGPLYPLMRHELNKKGIQPLATRRANFLAWQGSGGKIRKATPAQVSAQVPWAKAQFGKKIPSFLRSVISGEGPSHVLIKKTPFKTKIGGSYARFEMLAPGDNLSAPPFMGGIGKGYKRGRKPKLVRVASFVIGDDGDGQQQPQQQQQSAPAAAGLASIIQAPINWIRNIVAAVFGISRAQAPAQLPQSTDDQSLAAAQAQAAQDDGSASPDGGAPDDGGGSAAPADGGAPDDGSADDGSMQGDAPSTFMGRGKHGGHGQGGGHGKALSAALTSAGISHAPGAVWDKAMSARVALIARQLSKSKKVGKFLRHYVRSHKIKATLPNGAVIGDVSPDAPPPAAPPPVAPPPTAVWRGAPSGPKGVSRHRRRRRIGQRGQRRGQGVLFTTVLNGLSSAGVNVTQGATWTKSGFEGAVAIAVQIVTQAATTLPATAQQKNPNSLGRAMVKAVVRRRAIRVMSADGTRYYVIKTADGKWVQDTTATPPDFMSKLNLVRNTFAAERDRRHTLLATQNQSDLNFSQSAPQALQALQTAGLPVDQIKLSPQGTLMAGVFIGAFDLAKDETEDFIKTGQIHPSEDESEAQMFNDGIWIDKTNIDKEAVDKLDEEMDADSDKFGTSEHALWMRPALVGTFVGDTDPATGLDKLWWQPLQYFQDSSQKVYNAAALATPAAAAAAPSGGGGGGGGPSGGGGGGGDDGGGGGGEEGGGAEGGAAPDGGGEGGGGGGEMDPADYERMQEAQG